MSILASSLTLGSADYKWRDDAICRDTDPELFFPVGTTGNGAGADRSSQGSVRRVPRVAQACLDFALETNQDSGIWGGLDRGGAPRHPPPPRRRLRASAASADRPAAVDPASTASTGQSSVGTLSRITVP